MGDLREQLQSSLGDAYTIERELSGAGMSRVFVAEDTSLSRRVVVKVLSEELTGSVSTARFRREISLAARLQHPHIVPLLAAGETDGIPYYIMPFVDGDSLRAKLARGEMPIGETISILRDVAKALAFAHGQGVAHRDIKPDNVLISGTSAVITDFGVAKAISEAAIGGALTSIGVALGTPAYMAPEQAAADPATDLRADIYAFGAMAFELLAGHAPFAGRNARAVLAAHATEAPQQISQLRPAAPPALAELVMRCLEKRPGDRPQTATELVLVLDSLTTSGTTASSQRVMTPASRARTTRPVIIAAALVACAIIVALGLRARSASAADIRSLAVLPFENTSHDTTFDYLEEGITDQVRDALNAIPALTVKARSSSQQLKGQDSREIGRKLGVGAVLRGTVSRSTSHLHVTAELVRTDDDVALWSNTFDGQPGELGGMQDTIVRAIVGKLGLADTRGPAGHRAASRGRGTTNIEAYDAFLKGRHFYDHLEFGSAIPVFEDAVRLDPRFALAYAYLGMSLANMPTLGTGNVDSMDARARVAVARAIALDSNVAEAYVGQSFILSNELRVAESVAPLQKAASIDTNSSDILSSYGMALGQVGRPRDGLTQLRRARKVDPFSAVTLGLLSAGFVQSRQFDSALVLAHAALDLDPTNALIHQSLGFDFAFMGQPDSAVAAFEAAFRLNPKLFNGRSNLVFGYAVAGRWADADAQRALFMKEDGGNSPYYRNMIVDIAFGEYDAAMTAMERGVARREPLFGIVSLPCDPWFDPLKSDPRFGVLMQRIGATACPASGAWPITRR